MTTTTSPQVPAGHAAGTEPIPWLGRSIPRREDARFLTGRGQYVDDIVLPGMLHAAILRSPHAHALIKNIDASAALKMPGVYGVITGQEVKAAIQPERGRTYPAGGECHFIATDRVRYYGEPVAIVAAEDRYLAEDALEAIEVEYEILKPVLDPEHAADPDQPVLHDGSPDSNRVAKQDWSFGDVDAAFSSADVVVRERLEIHRYSSTPMECLAVIASYDPYLRQVTAWANIGNLSRYTSAAKSLKIANADFRLFVPDVGGSFGIKAWVHQRAVLMAVLSQHVGRPVKWVEDRAEHLAASHHAAPRIGYIELAARRDGTILALKLRTIDDQGAYVALNEPFGPILIINSGVVGGYHIPNVRVETECVVTNQCPVASNRGYGRVQHFFILERAIDRLALRLAMDPVELRRKNLIPASAFPYTTASGTTYDTGDPEAVLDKALELLDYAGARREQEEARREGRLLGIGVALSAEASGPDQRGQSMQWGIRPNGQLIPEVASIQISPDGKLQVQTPTVSQGQGHETTITQIVADQFGVDPSVVEVTVRFDSALTPYTAVSGTYASRFHATGAPAVFGAAGKLRTQLASLAAKLLEVSPDDIEFQGGSARVKGVPERAVTLTQLARTAYFAPEVFKDLGTTDLGLQATYRWNWPVDRHGATYSFLCHAAVVEVDPRTGQVRVLRYVAVEDIGRVLHPQIATGQTQGGVMHGIGGALLEKFAYDEHGQLLSTTFMDYLVPRFTDAPPLQTAHLEYPTPYGPLGAKGVAEGGSVLPPPTLGNAVEDAIAHLGGRLDEAYLAPEAVYRAMRSAVKAN
jgi:2-furoyl-CoA dehydrogenase large subunit